MAAQNAPSPTNAPIASMIIALSIIAAAVLIWKAQGVMVVICLRICRYPVPTMAIVGIFGHPRVAALSAGTATYTPFPSSRHVQQTGTDATSNHLNVGCVRSRP